MEHYQWHKDPAHKNLYASEMEALAGGLGGDLRIIETLKVEKTQGRIVLIALLRFGKDQWQAIQIIFPCKYPYAHPLIIPLQTKGTEPVLPYQHQKFGNGQQYGNDTLCLFRKDLWNKDEGGIGWVLRRAQGWLEVAHSPEGFQEADRMEEYPLFHEPAGFVLMPKDFVPPPLVRKGQLLLKQFKPNYFILEDNVLPKSPFDLQVGLDSFTYFVFEGGKTLKDVLPAFDAQQLIRAFSELGDNFLMSDGIKNFAFYLPSDKNLWHFFRANVQLQGTKVNIQRQYLVARNIQKELYLRSKDLFDEKILLTKRVTILGLGALGSEVARSLARNAVGHFNLFDKQKFEIGNSIRHAADLFYLGEDKVRVAELLILRTNPNITTATYMVDIMNDAGQLQKVLAETDLCIVLTGEDDLEYFINDKFVPKFPIPFIFAGVSPGALSGSAQVVKHKETPCLRCLSRINADTLPLPAEESQFKELPPEMGDCSTPALPGSEIDTKEIALQVSRLALQILLEKENSNYPRRKGSQYYWHGPAGSTKADPFTWEIKDHRIDKDCEQCNQ